MFVSKIFVRKNKEVYESIELEGSVVKENMFCLKIWNGEQFSV